MDSERLIFMREFSMTDPPEDFRAMDWKELHEHRSRLRTAMKELVAKCEKDKKNPTDDQLTAFRYAENIIADIDREFNCRDAAGSREPRGPSFRFEPGIRRGDGEIEPERETTTAGGVGRRYSEIFHGRKNASLSRGDFKSFGEFLEVASSGKYDARAMTTVLSDGGSQVPEFWAREIFDATMEESVCLGRCRVYPMASGTLHVPCWDSEDHSAGPIGSFAASWLEENSPATEVNPKMRLLTLEAKKLGIYVSASREVLEDGLSLESQIGPTLRQSLGFAMDDAVINGSGVARPLGIRNAASTISVNRQLANAISYVDVMNIYTRLLPSMVSGAQWIVSPDALRQLLAMVDGASHYIWVPSTSGVAQGVPGYLLGAPVYVSEKSAKLGTKGDLVLCNLGAYAVGVRKEIILEKSNAPFWSRDLMSFRVIVRFNGAPLLNAPIVPANGSSSTLSWAVALDLP